MGFILLLFTGLVTAASPVRYEDELLSVDLHGAHAVRTEPGQTQYPAYLPQPVRTIDFCQWQPQPPEVQQVLRPASGFLCELHVLPSRGERTLEQAVRNAVAAKHEAYQRSFNLRVDKIAGHRVLCWRFQSGKTRLDHFAIAGNKYDYLFVSSPYGSNGMIEEILKSLRIKPAAYKSRMLK